MSPSDWNLVFITFATERQTTGFDFDASGPNVVVVALADKYHGTPSAIGDLPQKGVVTGKYGESGGWKLFQQFPFGLDDRFE